MSTTFSRFFLRRIELIFLSVLLVAAAGVWSYQALWAGPMQQCESSGNWWDQQTRTCGHVVYLPDITHRPPGSKRPVYPTLPSTAVQGAGGTSQVR